MVFPSNVCTKNLIISWSLPWIEGGCEREAGSSTASFRVAAAPEVEAADLGRLFLREGMTKKKKKEEACEEEEEEELRRRRRSSREEEFLFYYSSRISNEIESFFRKVKSRVTSFTIIDDLDKNISISRRTLRSIISNTSAFYPIQLPTSCPVIPQDILAAALWTPWFSY
ncbi:hypothetical protein TIFTF001_037149 [Ficus carica]|uniref:Uncharacterized protein n=1 Tax=Ficus carica TaxID=3494 RepID=A0AA88JDF2_FICCA|nr:hypothetical protein TIFTF001_037149 [Ficus carica]